MTRPEINKLKRLAGEMPACLVYEYEQVDWEDGNKSFEMNYGGCFVAIRESEFEHRPDARRFANFYSAVSPIEIIHLIQQLDEFEHALREIKAAAVKGDETTTELTCFHTAHDVLAKYRGVT